MQEIIENFSLIEFNGNYRRLFDFFRNKKLLPELLRQVFFDKNTDELMHLGWMFLIERAVTDELFYELNRLLSDYPSYLRIFDILRNWSKDNYDDYEWIILSEISDYISTIDYSEYSGYLVAARYTLDPYNSLPSLDDMSWYNDLLIYSDNPLSLQYDDQVYYRISVRLQGLPLWYLVCVRDDYTNQVNFFIKQHPIKSESVRHCLERLLPFFNNNMNINVNNYLNTGDNITNYFTYEPICSEDKFCFEYQQVQHNIITSESLLELLRQNFFRMFVLEHYKFIKELAELIYSSYNNYQKIGYLRDLAAKYKFALPFCNNKCDLHIARILQHIILNKCLLNMVSDDSFGYLYNQVIIIVSNSYRYYLENAIEMTGIMDQLDNLELSEYDQVTRLLNDVHL